MNKPKRRRTVRWYLYINADIAKLVEQELLDPLTGRAAYGARHKLVEKLLFEWLKDQRQHRQNYTGELP